MKIILISLLLSNLILPTLAKSATISLYKQHNMLSVTVHGIEYPERKFVTELSSGLPTTISFRYAILKGNESIMYSIQVHTIIYDLWDEVYRMKSVDSIGERRSKYQDINALKQALSNFMVKDLFLLSKLPINEEYKVGLDVLLNPISPERIEKVNKWVVGRADAGSRLRRYDPTPPSVLPNTSSAESLSASRGISSGPRFKKLFDTIFEQYLKSHTSVGIWSLHVESKPFTVEALIDE